MSQVRPGRPSRSIAKAAGFALAVLAAVLVTAAAGPSPGLSGEPGSVATEDEPLRPVPAPPALDPRVVALGRDLFADKRLSANGAISCLSCHDTATNGATSRQIDQSSGGVGSSRNTPTIFNVALSFRLNWTGDTRTLQSQAEASLRVAMGQDAAAVARQLSADADMVARFQEAFGRGPDRPAILDALAAFEQTLLTPESAFDLWLKGVPNVLPQQAQQGYQLFKSLGCISCHQGVNVGGNLFQTSGVYGVLSDPSRPVLRVPSLRNVATTAPYFHDGSTPTLSDAVRMMARAQLDRMVSDQDVSDIVAFLESLTGRYQGHPVTAPRSAH